MDPKLLMELSQLVQQLPPHQLQKMQTLMHNMMAGYDVKKEMEEFEKSLPPGFREKLASLMVGQSAGGFPFQNQEAPSAPSEPALQSTSAAHSEMNIHDARLTILKAVAEGQMSPEEAEKLLFSNAS
jgi:hypothetical protein